MRVIYGPLSSPKSIEDIREGLFNGLQYEFEANNIFLGEGGVSVAELRPILVTELSMDNLSTLLNWNSSPPASLFAHKTLNQESMREYADLKFSLLIYDLILILTGSTILTFSSGEKAAYSFLFGGIGGFLYLLLLQRSVDGLSPPSSPSADGKIGNFMQALRGFKGPLLSLALVTSVIAVKYGMGGSSAVLTPTELFVGIAGFLACKIAVVLAAFRPIKRSPKENM